MTKEELLLSVKNVGMDTLVPLTDIKTEEDLARLKSQNYVADYTVDAFAKDFPDIDVNCVYYTPSISINCLYFNKETMAAALLNYIFFALGGTMFKKEDLSKALQDREEEAKRMHFWGSIHCLPDAMVMEYFKLLVDKYGAFPGLYNLFISYYRHADYGFNSIDEDMLKIILDAKTDDEKEKIRKHIETLPETFTVYRGGNSKSAPYEQGYSWSVDINVANFFAARPGYDDGYIAIGEVNKADVIDAFLEETEQEIVISPGKVRVREVKQIHGISYLNENLPIVREMFQFYRNYMDDLYFVQDSAVHGKAHQGRVLILCLLIANHLGLTKNDMRTLATAAVYHDTQRDDDEVDVIHGAKAADYYLGDVDKPDPVVAFLCEYHCLDDEVGYNEIKTNRTLSKNRTKNTLLYNIFKDADALDRVRFGIMDLDINQLRLPVSKQLTLAAEICRQQLQF